MIEVTTVSGAKMCIMWRHIATFFACGKGTAIYLDKGDDRILVKEDYDTVKKIISMAMTLESGDYMVKNNDCSDEPFREFVASMKFRSFIDSMRECGLI